MTYTPKSERLHVDKSGRPPWGVGFNEGGADLTELARLARRWPPGPIIGGTATCSGVFLPDARSLQPRQAAGLFFASAKKRSVYTLCFALDLSDCTRWGGGFHGPI